MQYVSSHPYFLMPDTLTSKGSSRQEISDPTSTYPKSVDKWQHASFCEVIEVNPWLLLALRRALCRCNALQASQNGRIQNFLRSALPVFSCNRCGRCQRPGPLQSTSGTSRRLGPSATLRSSSIVRPRKDGA